MTSTRDPDSPHALRNPPDLSTWSANSLLRDYTVNVELDVTQHQPDMSPDTVALRAEILRRMERTDSQARSTQLCVHAPWAGNCGRRECR